MYILGQLWIVFAHEQVIGHAVDKHDVLIDGEIKIRVSFNLAPWLVTMRG